MTERKQPHDDNDQDHVNTIPAKTPVEVIEKKQGY